MKSYPVILLTACICLTAGLAVAQEPLPRESGFSGYIELLGGFITTNSQLNTDGENKKTDSLDTSGERVNKFKPMPLGLIRYTFAEQRTQLFMGVPPENLAQGQFFVEAGVRHILSNGTGLRASGIPLAPTEQETWEDPFVVGQNRQRTDIESYGFKLAAETILGSGLTVKYGWLRQKLDDEKSGTFLLSQPGNLLTPDDLDDLDRDAHFHRLSAEYAFRIGPRMRLTPLYGIPEVMPRVMPTAFTRPFRNSRFYISAMNSRQAPAFHLSPNGMIADIRFSIKPAVISVRASMPFSGIEIPSDSKILESTGLMPFLKRIPISTFTNPPLSLLLWVSATPFR